MNTYTYAYPNPITFYDANGLLSYNKPPPATVPVSPEMEAKVICIENCMGVSLVVTGGAETYGHSPGSKHYSGQAVDIGFNSNPGIQNQSDKFFCCAGDCGFKYGQTEGNHFHIQTPLGKRGGSGEVREPSPCEEC